MSKTESGYVQESGNNINVDGRLQQWLRLRPATELEPDGLPPASMSFTPNRPTITVEQILRIQGYSDLARVRPAVRNAAETVTEIANRAIACQARYRCIGVESCVNGVLSVAEGTRFHCGAFDKYLVDCREVVIFVLTLGGGIDQVGRNLVSDGRLLEAVLLEAAGWMAIEQATKSLVRHLRSLNEARGLVLTRRMAPGYQFRVNGQEFEWPLLEHAAFFKCFGSLEMPVRVLESGGMVPKMSRTGLYGLRSRDAVAT